MARELGRPITGGASRERRDIFSRDALAMLADGVRRIAGGARYRESRDVISRAIRCAVSRRGAINRRWRQV